MTPRRNPAVGVTTKKIRMWLGTFETLQEVACAYMTPLHVSSAAPTPAQTSPPMPRPLPPTRLSLPEAEGDASATAARSWSFGVWTPNESVHTRNGALYWMTSARVYSVVGFDLRQRAWREVKATMAELLEWMTLVSWPSGKLGLVDSVGSKHGTAWTPSPSFTPSVSTTVAGENAGCILFRRCRGPLFILRWPPERQWVAGGVS
ncbi:F-box only protein 6-like [Canna indica]|uniref:F-box only protein 6-like n=1 Tax=Canna indica TaxID=4628 RepID=A0AAQ3JV48_9LILI|nr:F-box only protein 6-like [Canna indica]